MKNILKSLLCTILIIFNTSGKAQENKILIKVDNEIITSYDLLIEIAYLSSINENFKKLDINKSIEVAKNSLIKEKIKEIELRKYVKNFEIEEKQLNIILLNYFKQYGIKSIQEFDEFFIAKNINPKTIKKKISLEILWNQFIVNKFSEKIKVDKELIKKEVLENSKQKEFLLSEILFDVKENEKFKIKFDKIEKEIVKTSFAEAAIKFSLSDTAKNGGKLGWIKSSVLSKTIKEKLSNIDIGKFTSPTIIPGGFLILKVEDLRFVENEINLNQEISYIVQKKTEQQLNQFSNIHFKKIKKNIQINEL